MHAVQAVSFDCVRTQGVNWCTNVRALRATSMGHAAAARQASGSHHEPEPAHRPRNRSRSRREQKSRAAPAPARSTSSTPPPGMFPEYHCVTPPDQSKLLEVKWLKRWWPFVNNNSTQVGTFGKTAKRILIPELLNHLYVMCMCDMYV